MVTKNKRLRILSTDDITTHFGQPELTTTERSHYFSLSKDELKLCNSLSIKTRWYFILQLGYFKTKYQFFKINYSTIKSDIRFISQTYNFKKPNKNVSEETHRKIRNMIISHLGLKDEHNHVTTTLQEKAIELTSTTVDAKFIFQSLYGHALNKRLVMPQYTTFQSIISSAIKSESQRLQKIISKHLPKYATESLNKLLSTEENYYEITAIKKDQKNFTHDEVKKTIKHKLNYNSLYAVAKRIVPRLRITENMISYYGSLATHYPASRLKRLPNNKSFLYLLCYISQRMQKFNDNIMNSFVFYVDRYVKSGNAYGKKCIYEEKKSLNNDIKHNVPKVLKLFVEGSNSNTTIKDAGLNILPEDNMKKVIDYLMGDLIDEEYFRWQQYKNKCGEITKNLRPIFMSLNFSCNKACLDLDAAIQLLKLTFEQKKLLSKAKADEFPTEFIPNNKLKYIMTLNTDDTIKEIDYSKYEFCVYWVIRESFRKNQVTVIDSINHKSLEQDLVPKHRKKAIVKGLNNTLLSTPYEKSLDKAKESLDALYHRVNKRIETNENKSVRIEKQGEHSKLILSYNNKEDLTNHNFFNKLSKISVIDLLYFVNKATGFLSEFSHIKPHSSKSAVDDAFILGSLLANGTYHSLRDMANMSNLDYHLLFEANNNFIRLETIKAAADLLSDCIANLPIFSKWCIQPNIIHAGVDGQKFETRLDVLLARNSSKYFPLKKGIVAYTLLANFIPLSAETISPNLHESYFLFDIIKNQSTNIKIDSVSGDSHAINPVNFLLMQYLPVEFAPHLVNINNKVRNLHSFSHPNQYKDLLIKPSKQVRSDLILSEEDNMNWVIASLLHGDVPQNVIVKKLSSLAKYNQTCKAMAAYNRIFESMYTLNNIDDPNLRQYVRGTLNRTEAYHQMRRAITRANGGELRGGSEIEVMIWNECSRLLALAIIYYNARLLTALLHKYQRLGDMDAVETIKRISPIAWTHLLLLGKFEFILQPPEIDIDSMVRDVELY